MFGSFEKKPFVRKTEDEIMEMSVKEYNQYLIDLRDHELDRLAFILDKLLDTMCNDYIIHCKKRMLPIEGQFYIRPDKYGITEEFIKKFNSFHSPRHIRDYYLSPNDSELTEDRIIVKVPKLGARIL